MEGEDYVDGLGVAVGAYFFEEEVLGREVAD